MPDEHPEDWVTTVETYCGRGSLGMLVDLFTYDFTAKDRKVLGRHEGIKTPHADDPSDGRQ